MGRRTGFPSGSPGAGLTLLVNPCPPAPQANSLVHHGSLLSILRRRMPRLSCTHAPRLCDWRPRCCRGGGGGPGARGGAGEEGLPCWGRAAEVQQAFFPLLRAQTILRTARGEHVLGRPPVVPGFQENLANRCWSGAAGPAETGSSDDRLSQGLLQCRAEGTHCASGQIHSRCVS